ncbi:MAG TPA: GGDEF domain-containing protein [Gaiellaceae bacterium]|nr:GGDEF domain-containing protein [Gaiellaceae bacterium]
MSAALAPTRVLLTLSLLAQTGVFAAFCLFERPGLGIGHGYYLAIGLAAVASGPLGGALAGVLSTGLFVGGVYVNVAIPTAEALSVSTTIRCVMYVSAGVLLGWYSRRNRELTTDLTRALDELRVLAARDVHTGLGNTRAFEDAITRRLAGGRPFALLLASVGNDEDVAELARELSTRLPRHLPADANVTRVGHDTFAVLLECAEREQAGLVAAQLERALTAQGTPVTMGWATTPADGDSPLALYRAAEERLYVRRMVLTERPVPAAASGLSVVP